MNPLEWLGPNRLPATTLIVANLAVGAITLSGQWGFYKSVEHTSELQSH